MKGNDYFCTDFVCICLWFKRARKFKWWLQCFKLDEASLDESGDVPRCSCLRSNFTGSPLISAGFCVDFRHWQKIRTTIFKSRPSVLIQNLWSSAFWFWSLPSRARPAPCLFYFIFSQLWKGLEHTLVRFCSSAAYLSYLFYDIVLFTELCSNCRVIYYQSCFLIVFLFFLCFVLGRVSQQLCMRLVRWTVCPAGSVVGQVQHGLITLQLIVRFL